MDDDRAFGRGSVKAKERSREGLQSMSKAPSTSGQLVGATQGGLPMLADGQFDPEVDSPARSAHDDPLIEVL